MQGIVFDIKRFAMHDGPGIRTTVFFKGCPLHCKWCHNPESIGKKPFWFEQKTNLDNKTFVHNELVGKSYSTEQIMDKIKKDRIFMEESDGGVTFSGGEPTLQPEFLLELLKECKSEGIHSAVDTCGYASREIYSKIIPYTNLFLFDLKHTNPEKHQSATGKNNEIILDNLKYLLSKGCKMHVRIPVIPDFNNSGKELSEMALLLKSFGYSPERVDLLPYHSIASNKYKKFGIKNYMTDKNSLTRENIQNARSVFEEAGFKVKIGG